MTETGSLDEGNGSIQPTQEKMKNKGGETPADAIVRTISLD
jgi:hypothetical protein